MVKWHVFLAQKDVKSTSQGEIHKFMDFSRLLDAVYRIYIEPFVIRKNHSSSRIQVPTKCQCQPACRGQSPREKEGNFHGLSSDKCAFYTGKNMDLIVL